MKQYFNQIKDIINDNIRENRVNLFCIEGIDTPIIYRELCEYYSKQDCVFIGKLTYGKYNEFKSTAKEEWNGALECLEDHDFVDKIGSLTKWRNDASISEHTETQVTILMGLETAYDDKGSLGDFFRISPETIIEQINSHFGKWFVHIIDKNALNKDCEQVLDQIYKSLFSRVNVDLLRLSEFIDSLELTNFDTNQDLINKVFKSMNQIWGIPAVLDDEKIPKIELKKNNKKYSRLIEQSYAFIHREYSPLFRSNEKKIQDKLDKYAKKEEIDASAYFPAGTKLFKDYNEFAKYIFDFRRGKNVTDCTNRFLQLDFSIIDDIFNQKNNDRKKKEKNITITGSPVSTMLTMLCESILGYKYNNGSLPDNVTVRVEEVRLSMCCDVEDDDEIAKDSLESNYAGICFYLGGLLKFIGSSDFEIEIEYKDKKDPFTMDFYHDNPGIVKTTKRFNDNCHIKFLVVSDGDGDRFKSEYKWSFSPYSEWKNCFLYLRELLLSDEDEIKIPLIQSYDNFNELLSTEDSIEFYEKLSQCNFNEKMNNLFNDTISDKLTENEVNYISIIKTKFQNWICKAEKNGFFNALFDMREFICIYEEFIKYLRKSIYSYTDIQGSVLYLLSNIFTIINVNESISETINGVIIPVYHPAMLEKLDAKYLFMKSGMWEIVEAVDISNKRIGSINERIKELVNLSNITQALDVVWSDDEYFFCQHVWDDFYAAYYNPAETVFEAADSFISDVIYDDEGNIEYYKSPNSNIIANNILDYLKTFPARCDGLDTCFISPRDMQYIISGITTIKKIYDKKQEPLNINIKIICTDNGTNSVSYLSRWLDKIYSDESTVNIKVYLKYCPLKKLVDIDNIGNIIENSDLCFIYDILEDKNISFAQYSPTTSTVDKDGSKYPMVFAPDAISGTSTDDRKINISQIQFSTSKEHSKIVHRIGNMNSVESDYKVMRILRMTNMRKQLIDQAHMKCRWVVCVDEAIDKKLIQQSNNRVIGFTTGEGYHGELNVTVSAREDIIDDIKKMLTYRLKEKFYTWETDVVERAAKSCINATLNEVDGSRILKALNPDDYEIHNFLAYILMLKIMKVNENKDKYIFRELINLDSYKHWFDDKISVNNTDNSRPDFILIEIEKNDYNLDKDKGLIINIKIIECKMGNDIASAIKKAEGQVETGLVKLSRNWDSENESITRRYWFNQLYRSIIFTKLNMKDSDPDYTMIRDKIFNILQGRFMINWSGDIFAFDLLSYSDIIEDELVAIENELIEIDYITLHTAGQIYIQRNLSSETDRDSRIYQYIEMISDDGIDNAEAEDEQENDVDNSQVESNGIDSSKVISPDNSAKGNNGSKDYEINSQIINNAMGSGKKELENVRFLLGSDLKTGEKYYWDFGNKKLNNRHLMINGNSGCGKTYCIQGLLMEASHSGIPSVIFDYTGGFDMSQLDNTFKENCKIRQRIVYIEKIPVNPFKKYETKIGNMFVPENDVTTASKIASIFTNVYKFGDQQRSAVYKATLDGLKVHGGNMHFGYLAENLEELKATTVLSKIQEFLDLDTFVNDPDFSWQNIHDSEGEVYIIQLQGYNRDVQMLMTEILLWDIWNYATKNGSEDKPLILVLDEAQNLSHKEKTPSALILQEGRKFGLSGWYATQFMKPQLDDAEIQRLQQSGQKLYFCPPDNGVDTVAKNIGANSNDIKKWSERLPKLNKGECVTCGSMMRYDKWTKYQPRVIKVPSMEERISEHK